MFRHSNHARVSVKARLSQHSNAGHRHAHIDDAGHRHAHIDDDPGVFSGPVPSPSHTSMFSMRSSNSSPKSGHAVRDSTHSTQVHHAQHAAGLKKRRQSLHPANFQCARQGDRAALHKRTTLQQLAMQHEFHAATSDGTPGSGAYHRAVLDRLQQIASSDGSLDLSCVLRVIHSLLTVYEVKFTLKLLENFFGSRTGKYKVGASMADFAQDLQYIADSEQNHSANDEAISIMQKVASQVLTEKRKSGHARNNSSDGHHVEEGFTTTRSTTRSTHSRSTEQGLRSVEEHNHHHSPPLPNQASHDNLMSDDESESEGEEMERRSRGLSEGQELDAKDTTKDVAIDLCDSPPPGSGLTAKQQPTRSGSEVSTLSIDRSDPLAEVRNVLEPGTSPTRGRSPIPSPKTSTNTSVQNSQHTSSLSPDEFGRAASNMRATHSGQSASTKTTAWNMVHSLVRKGSVETSDLYNYIDLDDVSFEQVAYLATPSDRFILHPNHKLRITADSFVLFLIMLECLVIPLSMSFDMSLPSIWIFLCLLFFGIDMMASFTTGYFHDDLLIMRRSWITINYLRTWFFLDFVSAVPWDEVFILFLGTGGTEGSEGRTPTLLRMLKLGKLLRVIRLLHMTKVVEIQKRLQGNGLLPRDLSNLKFGVSVLKLFLTFGVLSHWFACIWGLIGLPDNVGDPSEDDLPHLWSSCTMGGPCEPGIEGTPWRHRYGIDNHDSTTAYFVALQYSASLLSGGDAPLHPGSTVERIFVIVVMFISVFVTSVVTGEILLIMNRQQEAAMEFNEKMSKARDFMSARKVPRKMQVRVYKYLETRHAIEYGHDESNRQFMTHLSEQLQTELVEWLNSTEILRHPFFQKLTDQDAIKMICVEAIPVIFAASEFVVEKGMPATCAHFLVRGKVRVESPTQKQANVLYLKPPCWIGDSCLFVDTLRKSTVTAVIVTETLSLQKSSLESVCCDYPSVKKAFEEFRNNILTNQMDALVCTYCGDLGHCEAICPQKHKSQNAEKKNVFTSFGKRTLTHTFTNSRLTLKNRSASQDSGGSSLK